MAKKLIAQGAEAHIFRLKNQIIKQRLQKAYRLPELDNKIRFQRTRKEAKLLEKASKHVPTPKVLNLTQDSITMEEISGEKLASCLESLKNKTIVAKKIGDYLAKLHDDSIIHGDLTTSNIVISKSKEIYFIDFGLGFISDSVEDKAVDLHVLKEALLAKHPGLAESFFKKILEFYKANSSKSAETLKRLEKVELRGRYKQQY